MLSKHEDAAVPQMSGPTVVAQAIAGFLFFFVSVHISGAFGPAGIVHVWWCQHGSLPECCRCGDHLSASYADEVGADRQQYPVHR